MSGPVEIRQIKRNILVALALGLCIVLAVWRVPRLLDARVLGVADFVEYWSAGRVNLSGGNPYAADELMSLQRAAGWDGDTPIPMWNPFWTLTLATPFSVLPFSMARLLWLMIEVGIVLGCADFLWRYYGGAVQSRCLAWLIALTFCPTLIVLRMGQMGPFLLLGLCLCLRFVDRPRTWIAAAALVLATVKPHLLYLFWVALALWVLSEKRWRFAVYFGSALTLTAILPIIENPHLLAQYRTALADRLASETLDYMAPTPGAFLRLLAGERFAVVQYVPTALGLVWVIAHWFRYRRDWRWSEQLPLLLLVSYATAVYGWLGDQVVLLAALLPAAVWLQQELDRRFVLMTMTVYGLLNASVLATKVIGLSELGQFWVAPCLCGAYVYINHRRHAARVAAMPQLSVQGV